MDLRVVVGAGVAVATGYVLYRNSLKPPEVDASQASPVADYDGQFYAKYLDGMLLPVHRVLARTARRAADELLLEPDDTPRVVRQRQPPPRVVVGGDENAGEDRAGDDADYLELSGRAVDCCCGTGQCAAMLASADVGGFSSVLGIDLSPGMIEEAKRRTSSSSSSSSLSSADDGGAGGRSTTAPIEFELGDAIAVLGRYPDDYFDVATVCLSLHEMNRAFRVPLLVEMGRVARVVVAVDFPADMAFSRQGVLNRVVEFLAGWEHWANNRDFRFVSGGIPGLARDAGLRLISSKKSGGHSMEFAVLAAQERAKGE